MKRRSVLWLLFVVALVAAGGLGVSSGRAAGTAGVASGGAPLRKVAEFELPGPPGKRFDYLTIDEDDNYLLSAHLAAGLLHVIDLKTNAVVKTVRDVPGVEGVAYIAEGKKVYTANWGENKIGVIDLARAVSSSDFQRRRSPTASPMRGPSTRRTCPTSARRRRASSMSRPTPSSRSCGSTVRRGSRSTTRWRGRFTSISKTETHWP